MAKDLNEKLEAARAAVAKLENELASKQAQELASLPSKYGFVNLKTFIRALKAAAGGKSYKGSTKAGQTRKRAIINEETKAKVKALVAGGKTGLEIAAAVGISVPSVHNIKKELGLTKARKK